MKETHQLDWAIAALEAAEAEVVGLRARVAELEAERDALRQWLCNPLKLFLDDHLGREISNEH